MNWISVIDKMPEEDTWEVENELLVIVNDTVVADACYQEGVFVISPLIHTMEIEGVSHWIYLRDVEIHNKEIEILMRLDKYLTNKAGIEYNENNSRKVMEDYIKDRPED